MNPTIFGSSAGPGLCFLQLVMEHQVIRMLTPADREKIIENLNECLAIFDRQQTLLSATEIRAKSMLSVLRNEFLRAHKNDNP